jgi:hypothetical protein
MAAAGAVLQGGVVCKVGPHMLMLVLLLNMDDCRSGNIRRSVC